MNDHIRCLKKACDSLGIRYESVGESGVFLAVFIAEQPQYFIANEVPFNNNIISRIVVDKGYTNDLLADVIRMPKTITFLDPNCEEMFQPYVEYKTPEAIAEHIIESFGFPVIVKKNSGSQGIHVFRCITKEEVLSAIDKIFDKSLVEYDHILLAQENIDIQREFRVTVFQGKVVLIYEKDFSNATFVGNLSPLHWEGAVANIIDDQLVQDRIAEFIHPIFKKLDLVYGGLDIALDTNDELCLFEINSKPAYNYLIESSGEEPLIGLYKKMLMYLQSN